MADPLVAEALKKAAVAWVAPAGRPARALWCMGHEDALWVVIGPGEQSAPGLEQAGEAYVTLRGDHGGRIITWRAAVSRVEPGQPEWDDVVPRLAGKRLNAPTDAAGLVSRWEHECQVHKLSPVGEPTEAGVRLPDVSHAAPPRTARHQSRRNRRRLDPPATIGDPGGRRHRT